MTTPLETEMAKAAGQIVVDSAKDARKSIATVFGDAANEVGLILGDQLRGYRAKNMIDIMKKVERLANERGLSPEQIKALPFGDGIRIAEAASMEEEEDIQELWARLIANATDPENAITIRKSYLDLLKSLSPIEAALLDFLYRFQKTEFSSHQELADFNAEAEAAVASWRAHPEEERKGAVQNLARLRCVAIRDQIVIGGLLAQVPRELIDVSFSQWSLVDAERFGDLLTKLSRSLQVTAGAVDYDPQSGVLLEPRGGFSPPLVITVPELNYVLTTLGRDMLEACGASRPEGPRRQPQPEPAAGKRGRKMGRALSVGTLPLNHRSRRLGRN